MVRLWPPMHEGLQVHPSILPMEKMAVYQDFHQLISLPHLAASVPILSVMEPIQKNKSLLFGVSVNDIVSCWMSNMIMTLWQINGTEHSLNPRLFSVDV